MTWKPAKRYFHHPRVHFNFFTVALFKMKILKCCVFSFQQTKPSKLKGLKKHKAKVKCGPTYYYYSKTGRMTCSLFIFSSSSQSKAMQLEWEDPPGATSSDFLSEAAKVIFTARRLNDQSTHDGLLSQQIVSK